jgi:RNAse (barnase) inhibitor barstar
MTRKAVTQAALETILGSSHPIIEVNAPLEELVEGLEGEGYFATLVDRAPVFNKETLLHALYQSCEMPAYFGFNWDALYDMLVDFSWQSAKGYVLIFKDFSLLEQRSPEVAETFLEILLEASKRRVERPSLYLVLLSPSYQGADNIAVYCE